MSKRRVWAFRLVVDIPPECLAPGFVPEPLLNVRYRDLDREPFTWLRRRLYFDWSSACHRAHLLSTWGATVTVERVILEDWTPVCVYRPGVMCEAVAA